MKKYLLKATMFTAGTLLLSTGLAHADSLYVQPAKWDGNLPATAHGVENNLFVKDTRTLQGRSPKAQGGYTYNPLCKVLSSGDVGAATPYWANGTQKFKCFGTTGELITNVSDFTTETKQMVTTRGYLSPWTLGYTKGTEQRILCLGKVNNQEMPGFAPVPASGQLPAGCKVKLGGNWTTLPDYSVWRHKTSSGTPALPPSGNGWWKPYASTLFNGPAYPVATVQPLFQLKRADGKTLCRVQDGGAKLGGLKLITQGLASKHYYTCEYSSGGSTKTSGAYEVYIAAHHATSATNPN